MIYSYHRFVDSLVLVCEYVEIVLPVSMEQVIALLQERVIYHAPFVDFSLMATVVEQSLVGSVILEVVVLVVVFEWEIAKLLVMVLNILEVVIIVELVDAVELTVVEKVVLNLKYYSVVQYE
jgi:hypothetical protein